MIKSPCRQALLASLGALAVALGLAGPLRSEEGVSPGVQAARVALGRRLFYDADLSINGTMACATCHEQRRGFGDGNATHPGARDDPGRRNVPGLANVGDFARLTWADPRQTSLEGQVDVPMLGHHPVEMAMDGHTDALAERLGAQPCYVTMFREAFPDEAARPDYAHAARAIAAFERTLVSRSAPWDRWRSGESGALAPLARAGAARFARDCASCHSGVDLTDQDYHRITAQDGADAGLMEVTGRAEDRARFRTPSLRNVAVTAPYLHDGSAPDLASAIRAHAAFADADAVSLGQLSAFLGSLTDHAFLTNPAFALPMEACGKPL
ncbi:cytochrome-c peroxidase [Novosphingobium sp. 1949]|uniref:Cytochrome-c peroxidase n=1 Tax=Novosphingobium organovorum TaxID=2930092 RepID=A0ABT0B7P8_9SPHN|nr:cytochrome c peroxidase [Novosphingobium organovorum]MCJ2181101.1 cytochrome-c peroxidase [Novosphingobium organovorum]